MILLTATTDKLQVISSAACDLDVHVSGVDYATATTFVRTNTNITTAATTDILAAPASSTTRNARNINIRNAHATNPVDVTVQFNQNGTLYELHKTTLNAGDLLEYAEGYGFFLVSAVLPGMLIKVLTADDTGGQNVATAQPWFPTAGAVTVAGSTTYIMRGLLMVTHGATTHTTALSFTGTATLTSIDYYATTHRSAANAAATTFNGIEFNAATTSGALEGTSTAAGTYIVVNGIIRINAGGTVIPNFIFSANPTGTITVKRNTFFSLQAIGDNNLAAIGTWA